VGISRKALQVESSPDETTQKHPRTLWKWLLSPAKVNPPFHIVLWWELRRPIYNLAVLPFGVLGLLFTMVAIDLHLPDPSPKEDFVPLLGVAGAAIGANMCYTGGCVVEFLARRRWKDKARRFGPIAWSAGSLFSIVMCFVPGLLHMTMWAVGL